MDKMLFMIAYQFDPVYWNTLTIVSKIPYFVNNLNSYK